MKSTIIARAWSNSQVVPTQITLPNDMTLNANEGLLVNNLSIVTDRNLMGPLELKAGTVLSLYPNTKRPGRKDPDFTVSIKLPEDQANEMINFARNAQSDWRNKQSEIENTTLDTGPSQF